MQLLHVIVLAAAACAATPIVPAQPFRAAGTSDGLPQPKRRPQKPLRGPAQLLVFRKGVDVQMQAETFARVMVTLTGRQEILINASELYDDQKVINTGAFNFDGEEDFAVQTGHDGPYGGPTYTVYLYSPQRSHFVASEALSRLTQETLGFFRVDAKGRRLVTQAKSGCCYHETVEHRVTNDVPVAVLRVIEDATGEGDVKVTRERLVNGRWQRTTQRVRREPGH